MQNSKLQFKIQNLRKTLHFTLLIFHFGQNQVGQALVTLLFFMIVAITVTSAAIIIMLIQTVNTTASQQGMQTYYAAESGIENALIRLLRDPSYTGETINEVDTVITVQVSGTTPKTIVSQAKQGNAIRKIQAEASYTNNTLVVTSWKEVF